MDGPTKAEVRAARKWLAKRGVRVAEPTTLLALRLGARGGARPPVYWAWMVVQLMGYAGGVLLVRSPARWADRRAAAWLGDRRLDVPRPSSRKSPGGWYLASLVITFGGGALLAVVMCVTTSKWIWAVGWLVLLAVGAAVVLTGVVRWPVIAMPALPVLFDVLTSGSQPHEFTPWLVGYVGLAYATLLVSRYTRYLRRMLPSGRYGMEVAVR